MMMMMMMMIVDVGWWLAGWLVVLVVVVLVLPMYVCNKVHIYYIVSWMAYIVVEVNAHYYYCTQGSSWVKGLDWIYAIEFCSQREREFPDPKVQGI
jgi:hypothetical protein